MRQLPLAAAICAAIALGAASASAASFAPLACGTPDATVIFWPHGHPAVKRASFPRILTPHLEVYAPGAGYPSSNFQLYVDVKGGIDASASCLHGPSAKVAAITRPRTTSAAHVATCRAGAPLTSEVKKTKSSVTVIGRTAASEVWRAVFRKKGGATLTVDSTVCKIGAVPK